MSSIHAFGIEPAPGVMPAARGVSRTAQREGRAARVLTAALLLVILYAAFDHGAAGTAGSARVVVALCAIAAVAATGLLWAGSLRLAAPRAAMAGVGLLTAFTAWSAITLAWSASPDATWLEMNRDVGYVLALVLAILAGASDRRAPGWMADGFLAVSGLVTLYALGQKLVPELHVGAILNLNQAGPIPRLQEPLGYWNALALFIALGIPLACFRVLDDARSVPARLANLVAIQLMLVTLGFTLSRGGVLAVALGLAVAVVLGGVWLRGLMWLGCACVAAAPPLIFGLSVHALTAVGVSLHRRAGAGALLALLLVLCAAALVGGGRQPLRLEAARQLSPERIRQLHLGVGGVALAVVVALLAGLALSPRGLGGEISHAWHSFTATHAGSIYDPQHLLSGDSENRWVWWKEAAGAFSDRPLGGWGAGSFAVVHRLYRHDLLSVNQPHSLPLQFLAETGVVGALLALGGLALLLWVAIRDVRRSARGPERLQQAALLAAVIAYLIHVLYDWDWDIPAVTVAAIAFLGVLVGAAVRAGADARADGEPGGAFPDRDGAHAKAFPPGLTARAAAFPAGLGARAVALAITTVVLCVLALSAALPSLAASEASAALVQAGTGRASLASADAKALLAARLDPLSDAGPLVEATLAIRAGRLQAARSDLRLAISREPMDEHAWGQLAGLDLLLDDVPGAVRAADEALALDPLGAAVDTSAYQIAQLDSLLSTPPRDSATAISVPGLRSRRLRASRRPASTTPLSVTIPPVGTGSGATRTSPAVLVAPAPAATTAPSPPPAPPAASHRSGGGSGETAPSRTTSTSQRTTTTTSTTETSTTTTSTSTTPTTPTVPTG